MNLRVEILRISDGILHTDIWIDWGFNVYWWEDGNASCDCNRKLFFHRAVGEEVLGSETCGHGGYRVRLSNADTDEVLYDEGLI